MRSNYKKLGPYIQQVNKRNSEEEVDLLLGVSIQKILMPSIANTVGTNMRNYKIIDKGQFAYGPVTSRNGDKISVALLEDFPRAIVSQAYTVFEVINPEELLPEYLMMWFRRPEFDRYARYMSHGSARETFDWDEMCEVELPIPSPEKQLEIVEEYNAVVNRIKLNDELNQKLEETTRTIYNQWFEDYEFPMSKEYAKSIGKPELEGKPYRSNGGEMVYNSGVDEKIPETWCSYSLSDLSHLKYGKMLSASKFLPEGYPVYSGYGIRGYYNKYMYEFPQILVICRGVSGTGEVKMSPPQSHITNLSIVVELREVFRKGFLFYYLKNSNLRKLDSGSAQSQITIGNLEKVKIVMPANPILRDFQKIFEATESKINYNKKLTHKLEHLKAIILSRMSLRKQEYEVH